MKKNLVIRNEEELKLNVDKIFLSDCNVFISSVTNLESFKYFNTITNLKICAIDPIEFNENILIDTSFLNYLHDLKYLSIENDDHIENLNLSKLEHLDTLLIMSCHLLKNIEGLANLHNLRTLVIYDVPNLDRNFYQYLIRIISKTNIDRVILDITTYSLFSKEQLEKLKLYNIYFAEKIGYKDNYIYSLKMMEEYHKRALEVYKQVHSTTDSLSETLKSYYEYVKTVNYDDESLEKRQEYIKNSGKFYKFNNRFKSISSSYKALMQNSAICEGYVNLLRYFYSLENIDLYPVFCYYKNSSHVAGKAFIDGTEVYFDPELDRRFNNNNNYMTIASDFLVNHEINFYRDNFDIIIENNNRVRKE